jgi:hypothetical protein
LHDETFATKDSSFPFFFFREIHPTDTPCGAEKGTFLADEFSFEIRFFQIDRKAFSRIERQRILSVLVLFWFRNVVMKRLPVSTLYLLTK